jgi:EAL domain-containing protein (putative c-di-GMP-specific phosphodiesterase class I)
MAKDQEITLDAIAKALALGELVFFYQPILSLVTGKICGAEALIRWRRADGSLVPASMFIPLAEKTGFITEITRTMLPQFLADMMTIHQLDPSLTIALNVSIEDLATRDFSKNLLNTIQSQKLIIDPRKICVELTESQALNLTDRMQNTLFTLDSEGVKIAIDDFGTGYTSFALIRDLPIATLKIDKSFVNRVLDSEKCAKIVSHIISLAHQLGLETVSEGVETQAILDWLQHHGSTCAQGFYLSIPLPLPDFLAFILRDNRHVTASPLGLIHLAKQDHVSWQRDFVTGILNVVSIRDEQLKQKAYEKIPALDPKECLLGKWYYGVGQEFSEYPQFEQLGIEHEQLHQTANHLLHEIGGGASRTQIMKTVSSLHKHSDQVMRLLGELHTMVAIERETVWHNYGNSVASGTMQPVPHISELNTSAILS